MVDILDKSIGLSRYCILEKSNCSQKFKGLTGDKICLPSLNHSSEIDRKIQH